VPRAAPRHARGRPDLIRQVVRRHIDSMAQTVVMSSATAYQPGVCNIGQAEIRRRRASGYAGLAVAAVFLAIAFVLGWPAPWRLLVALPAFLSAQGFLQAAFRFCVGFATRGLYNFGELGTEETVQEAEFRKQDRRKALQISALAFAMAAAFALVASLVPVG
jgi:heme/copper-type cytochrome/quinol oxidase subunit 3